MHEQFGEKNILPSSIGTLPWERLMGLVRKKIRYSIDRERNNIRVSHEKVKEVNKPKRQKDWTDRAQEARIQQGNHGLQAKIVKE
jgi:hypothetical protein